MKPFVVYMLRCRNGSYYVGHTEDLEKRVAEHVEGTYGGHTSRQLPVKLVWSAECDTRDEALAREWQLKKWTRAKKEALVREDWARLKELARGPNRVERLRMFGVLPAVIPVRPEPFDSAAFGGSRQGPVRPERSGREATAESKAAAPANGAAPFDSGPDRSKKCDAEVERVRGACPERSRRAQGERDPERGRGAQERPDDGRAARDERTGEGRSHA
ncbi:GIY-YIG nuclease family protein [Anaeromyxobacter oryzisoli]|uniref:GIY-YIG nuclease family protein n=1 Tax=Anaeromyxobacter oryzisoli TaxID=2925408 RepID=UPI001F58DDCF|nr:GIY-YIG nuclease family protein [Anaeromyxobacter sp. SG63]